VTFCKAWAEFKAVAIKNGKRRKKNKDVGFHRGVMVKAGLDFFPFLYQHRVFTSDHTVLSSTTLDDYPGKIIYQKPLQFSVTVT